MLRRHLILVLALPLLISSSLPPGNSLAQQPAPRAAPVANPVFGVNAHLSTRYPDPASMDVPAAAVADLGVSWVREDFHWHRVQPRPDVWDWTFTDAGLRALLKRNVKVLGVLGPSVGWGTPFPGDTYDDVSYYAPDPDAFLAYVRGVVLRYHRYVDHWEVWNEPDHPYFWRPSPDPLAYASLLKRTAEVIRAIDPGATVLIGGVNPFDTTFLETVAEAGAWGSFDVLAIHPYVNPYEPENGNLAAATETVRGLGVRFGQRPVWVTEIGWSSGPGDRDPVGLTNEDFQASYLVRSMLLLWQGGAEKIFWYTLKDDPGNPYGLVGLGQGRTDYSQRKPAFFALQTLIRELRGATFVERRDLFEQQVVDPLNVVEGWRRVSQPNGTLRASGQRAHSGGVSAELRYNFTTGENDYVAFERSAPLPLAGTPYAVGAWVYGDGSPHGVKLWVRDAEGEVLQFVLGNAGTPGWHYLSAPLGGPVEPGNRIAGSGNGRVDYPAALVALVLDDVNDRYVGDGTIYIDDLTAVSGREAYDVRLQRGPDSLDILWSPPGVRLVLNTRTPVATLISRDGALGQLAAEGGRLRVNLGPAPIYLWHRR